MFTCFEGWAKYKDPALLNPAIPWYRRTVYADIGHSNSVQHTTQLCGNLERASTSTVADESFIIRYLYPCAITSAAISLRRVSSLKTRYSIAILFHVYFFHVPFIADAELKFDIEVIYQ